LDLLDSLVIHLSDDEQKEFSSYLARNSRSQLEPKLFLLLASHKQLRPSEMSVALYGSLNMNAYYSMRKQLIEQIFNFIVVQRLKLEADAACGVFAMVTVGRFMLEKNAFPLAGHYLKKAEQIAIKNHQYEELESIYKLLVTHSRVLELDLDEVSAAWEKNTSHYATFRKLTIASAFIRNKMEKAKLHAHPIDPEQMIDEVMGQIQLTDVEANNPAFLHTIISLARSAFASTKEYQKLEPYAIRIYNRLKKNDAFGPNDVQLEISFLFIIAHTLYRNRKFEASIEWLNKMENLLPTNKFKTTPLYPKYLSLKAATLCYTGENLLSIEVMEEFLKKKNKLTELRERFNMHINLAVYYFNAGEFRMANKEMARIGRSDKFLQVKMGKEWRFKKNMIEIIIHYELGNFELAETLLKRTKKRFAKFIALPKYQSAAVFMNFISKMILSPESISSAEFKDQVRETNIGVIDMKNDIQAVTFYSWLRSKMMNKNYYEVLLSTVRA